MGRFEDERGTIEDWFKGVTVTEITTLTGAVRGNHFHSESDQWTLVLSGRLLLADGEARVELSPFTLYYTAPGTPHAWKALEDTICLVFTSGPRAGDYESDTHRLKEPLL
jgi:quercetin dioxygenase-like cupin family protein